MPPDRVPAGGRQVRRWPGRWVLSLAGLVDGRAELAPDLALVRMVLAGRRARLAGGGRRPVPGRRPAGRRRARGLSCCWRWAAAAVPVSERRRTSGRPAGRTPEAAGAVITRGAQPRAPGPAGARAAL